MIPSDGQEADTLLTQELGFDSAFWMCNIMEMWERLAYYGMRMVVNDHLKPLHRPLC